MKRQRLIAFTVGFIYASGMNGCMAPFPNFVGTAKVLMGVFIFLGSIAGALIATVLSYQILFGLALTMLITAIGSFWIFMQNRVPLAPMIKIKVID